MKRPIRDQILWPLITLLTAAVAFNAILAAWTNSWRQKEMLRERHSQVVRVMEQASFPLSQTIIDDLAQLSGHEFVAWDESMERIVFSSRPISHSIMRELAQEIRKHNHVLLSDSLAVIEGETFSVSHIQLRNPASYQLFILHSTRTVTAATKQAMWPPALIGLLTIAVIIPLLISLANGWSRRLSEIQLAVSDIAEGRTTHPVAVQPQDDELSALVGDINRMAMKLDEQRTQLVQAERERLIAQVTAGFAHQLRNGLSGASLAVQLHSTRCPAAQHDKSLRVAERQLLLVSEEIRALLALGRKDIRPKQLVEICQLAREVGELVWPQAEHFGTRLLLPLADLKEMVWCNPEALRGAMLNLLLNAIEAAGPTGRVEVSIREEDDKVVVCVKDSGSGPSIDVSPKLGEPFVTSKQEGIGLGLTVVQSVAQDHQGTLTWHRHLDLTLFELRLPRSNGTTSETNGKAQ